jgi:hypothetical protein
MRGPAPKSRLAALGTRPCTRGCRSGQRPCRFRLRGAAGTGLQTTGTAHGSRLRPKGAGAAFTLANKMAKATHPRKGRALKRG